MESMFDALGGVQTDCLPDLSLFDLSRLFSVQKAFRLSSADKPVLYAGMAGFVTGVPGYEKEMFFLFAPSVRMKGSTCAVSKGVSRYFDVGYGKPVTREVDGMDGWRSSSGNLTDMDGFIRELLGKLQHSQLSAEAGPGGLLVLCPMSEPFIEVAIEVVRQAKSVLRSSSTLV